MPCHEKQEKFGSKWKYKVVRNDTSTMITHSFFRVPTPFVSEIKKEKKKKANPKPRSHSSLRKYAETTQIPVPPKPITSVVL